MIPPKMARSAEAAAGEARRVTELRREAVRMVEGDRSASSGIGSPDPTRMGPAQDDS